MPPGSKAGSVLHFHSVTPARWTDLETLFGERGACGGCWCMWMRLTRSRFEQQKGEGNRRAMKAIVDAGEVPGLLAYDDDRPIGWVSVAPREAYPVLERSRTLKPIDNQPVWSIVCLFIDKAWRGRGMMVKLVKAAVDYARSQGADIIEAYPVDPHRSDYPPAFAWPGIKSAFDEIGFIEVARRSETRPIMRLTGP
jgi:GNAT superfamily N-acetyltransferase